MTLRVERFDGSSEEWDAFGRAQDGWTAFHRLAWQDVVTRTFGHQCRFLCARASDGSLHGILPLVRVRSRMFGHYLISMPFVSYGGPLGTEAAVQALAAHADALAAETQADLLELRSAVALPLDWEVSHRKLTVVLPLAPGDPSAVFGAFKAKLRSQVRRPQKEGVEVRMGPDQVEPFHQVFARHMRDLGTPSMPVSWFRNIASAFGDDAWFACAWLDGRPIAGGAGFRWDGEFEITWASALREHSRISPNMAVYWALIERAAAEGLHRFNFGRCSPDSPTHRFKLQWGGRDEPLHWYKAPSSGSSGTPSPSAPGFSLATRAWQRLPLRIATMLGPRIVRFIP